MTANLRERTRYGNPLVVTLSRLMDLTARRKSGRRRGRRLRQEKRWPAWVVAMWQVGFVALVLTLWELGGQLGFIDVFFWSYPSMIYETFTKFVQEGTAYTDTWFTFRATVLGFAYGTISGAVIGLSFWWSRNYAAVAQPFLICFEAIPKLALAPLVILVFGMGLPSKVALGVAITVVVTTLTTFTAVRAIDLDSERLMYSLGANRWQVFNKLVIPSVLPWIISCLRVNIGLALTGAIVGEFISSQHGLGRQILHAGEMYDIALIWVAVIILSALAVVMYLIVGKVEKVLLKGLMRGSAVR